MLENMWRNSGWEGVRCKEEEEGHGTRFFVKFPGPNRGAVAWLGGCGWRTQRSEPVVRRRL